MRSLDLRVHLEGRIEGRPAVVVVLAISAPIGDAWPRAARPRAAATEAKYLRMAGRGRPALDHASVMSAPIEAGRR